MLDGLMAIYNEIITSNSEQSHIKQKLEELLSRTGFNNTFVNYTVETGSKMG